MTERDLRQEELRKRVLKEVELFEVGFGAGFCVN